MRRAVVRWAHGLSAPCAFVFGLLLAAGVAGCSFPATQLLVVVDSDYDDEELSTIEVRTYEVDEFRASFPDSVPVELRTLQVRRMSEAGVEIPFSYGVVPLRGDASRRVVIELTAFPRTGARVVVRAITGFVPRETRRVPMFISRNCEGVVCGVDDTCDESGRCVPAMVAPGPAVRPGEEFTDAGPRADAGMDAFSGPDAFRDDVFIPIGADADLDAPADPDAGMDAFVEPPDAWAPDAFVPPFVDAPFPDAFMFPDAWAPDAFSNDAFTPFDTWAPDAFTPDAFTPDAFTPMDGGFSPDAVPPDAFIPFDAHEPPDAYDMVGRTDADRVDSPVTTFSDGAVVENETGVEEPIQ